MYELLHSSRRYCFVSCLKSVYCCGIVARPSCKWWELFWAAVGTLFLWARHVCGCEEPAFRWICRNTMCIELLPDRMVFTRYRRQGATWRQTYECQVRSHWSSTQPLLVLILSASVTIWCLDQWMILLLLSLHLLVMPWMSLQKSGWRAR